VRLNRLARQIQVRQGSVQDVQPDAATRFDVVLANVTARVNTELAPWLAGVTRIRGHVVASGILADSAETVVDAFHGAGLLVREREQEGDWVALVAERAESLAPDPSSV
jgi:ribosomal protein L11 methyltransferase